MSALLFLGAALAVFCLGVFITASGISGSGFVLTTVILAFLKILGAFNWSWWWITLPAWGLAPRAISRIWPLPGD